jgi:antitoxin component YwqK of YwqJK toxin-antitoxin module
MNRIPWSELELDEDYRERHHQKPFTGLAFETDADGRLVAEAQFVAGLLNGRKTTWYPSGQIESEGVYRHGVTHGERRQWSENGRLRLWVRAENGIQLESKEWDESGTLIKHLILAETDPLWNMVRRARDRAE